MLNSISDVQECDPALAGQAATEDDKRYEVGKQKMLKSSKAI